LRVVVDARDLLWEMALQYVR